MSPELIDRLRAYRREAASLAAFVHHELGGRGSFVRVDAPSFNGVGVVVGYSPADPTRVEVMLQNGNVWGYAAECCSPASAKDACKELRLVWLRRRGVQCAGSIWRGPKGRMP